MILCFKVGDNGDFVFLSGTAIDGVLNHAQNGSILVKISVKVLATITIKFLQNVKSSINNRTRLVLHNAQFLKSHINKNKPSPSTNMPLPTFKLYYIDPPKMGWLLKTRSRTGNNGEKS